MIVFILTLISLFLIFNIDLKPKKRVKKLRKQSLKSFITASKRKGKENAIKKLHRETKNNLKFSEDTKRFKDIQKFSVSLSVVSSIYLFSIGAYIVIPVSALCLYFIPMWLTKLNYYKYMTYINDELEVAVSLITTTYLRTNNFTVAVEENVVNFNGDIKKVFNQYINRVKNIDANVENALQELKTKFNYPIFHSWIENVLLCQENSDLIDGLMPIVTRFSSMKKMSLENETAMKLPLQEAVMMVSIVLGCIPLLFFMNIVWFNFLVTSFIGQVIINAIIFQVMYTINKAIKLSSPLVLQL